MGGRLPKLASTTKFDQLAPWGWGVSITQGCHPKRSVLNHGKFRMFVGNLAPHFERHPLWVWLLMQLLMGVSCWNITWGAPRQRVEEAPKPQAQAAAPAAAAPEQVVGEMCRTPSGDAGMSFLIFNYWSEFWIQKMKNLGRSFCKLW